MVPGAGIPEGAGPVASEVCRRLARGHRLDELAEGGDDAPEPGRVLGDPEVEVRSIGTRRPLPAVLAQIADVGARYLTSTS